MSRVVSFPPECLEYRKWKKEEAARLKKAEQKKSRKKKKKYGWENVIDCLEDENKSKPAKTPPNAPPDPCSDEIKKKPPKRIFTRSVTLFELHDLIMKKLQPTYDDRTKFFNRRHASCTKPDTVRRSCGLCWDQRGNIIPMKYGAAEKVPAKLTKKKKRSRKKKVKAEDGAGAKAGAGNEDAEREQKEEGEEEGEATEEPAEEEQPEEEAPPPAERNPRTQKDMFWCRKMKRKKKKKLQPEEDICSICSFDSTICLQGTTLTANEKKMLQANRDQVHAEKKKAPETQPTE